MSPSSAAGFQLSPQQKYAWMFRAGESSPNAVVCVRMEGNLEAEKLRAALEQVVARHEILRTTFERRSGMKIPVQVVHEHLSPTWESLDLSSLDAGQQRLAVEKCFLQQKQISVPLEHGPVVRATLISLGVQKHFLVLVVPFLAADEWSLRNFASEIGRAYAGQALSEDVFQYADYSAFANELLDGEGDEDAAAGKRHWNELLSSLPPAVKIPFERKSAQNASFNPQTISVEIPREAEQLPDASAFFAACWHILLWRLSGQNQIAVAHVCNGRNHEEVAEAIGLFARSTPIVYDFEGQRTFASVQQDIEQLRSQAATFQDYLPLTESAQDVSVSFVAEDFSKSNSGGGTSFFLERAEGAAECFRIQLKYAAANGTKSLELHYHPQYFSREAAQLVADRLSVLARSAAQDPAASITDLAIMSAEERQRVTVAFNQSSTDYTSTQCIHYLFEERVVQVPHQTALRCGETSFTYAELNTRSNQLAHLLRRSGVKAGMAVPLCLDRSAEMIVALLGILKAGGAYVPLVPDNPKARLAQQLSDLDSPVLITEKKFLGSLPEFAGQIVCLDRDADRLAAESTANPDHVNIPSDTVYIIYTSGSTGVPKGVAVSHSNLVNYSSFISARLQKDREPLSFATVSTLAADLGNTAIFPALISGGCLHVIPYDSAMSAEAFSDYAKRHSLDVLKITPSHLSSLLAQPNAAGLLPRKYLILGGEAATWDLVARVQASTRCAVINHYGPTETTVGCCTFDIAANDARMWSPATVPIGRPIANAQVYILDAKLRPVPVGVPGEIFVGGAGVAKGYLNQPQQTSERFVRDSFSSDPAARLYRTGDLARFLPDGNIEFLGRIDQQVKIRGYRVEPAEIENVLKQHPSVQQAIVLPQEQESGDRRLIAYVVGQRKSASLGDELREFLQQRLPDYMVPAGIISLESLPLTRNGKINVAALPSPDSLISERAVIAPRNPLEQGLADIWRQVLGVEQVGVEDNFFDLGGHSLLATQVISRIRSTFRVQLPLRSLFDSPTVAGLAGLIAALPQNTEDDEVARLLQELEGISDEEAERLLAEEMKKGADGAASGN